MTKFHDVFASPVDWNLDNVKFFQHDEEWKEYLPIWGSELSNHWSVLNN